MAGFRNVPMLFVAVCGAFGVGCGPSTEPAADARVELPGRPVAARVVVAVIDRGINPYHAYFNASRPGLESPVYPPGSQPAAVTPEVLAEFGIDRNHVLTLTRTGNPADDLAADAALWAEVRPGEPYWFRGTNIIAVGRDQDGPLILPDDNTESEVHGVASAASVLQANPEAIIFFVENEAGNDTGSEASHGWAFLHPQVDIVSTSYGFAGGLPAPEAFFDTFQGVVHGGKLHFASAANNPSFTPGRDGAGPWWSIGVSGSHDGTFEDPLLPDTHYEYHGQTAQTATLFHDFVADAFQDLPYCATCQVGTRQPFGTSLSTPRAAGVASRVVLEARRHLGHTGGIAVANGRSAMVRGADQALTNWQIRRALEAAAYVPGTLEWEPEGLSHAGTIPVNPAAPWLQVGWGELTPKPEYEVVEQALAFLGFGGAVRQKDPGFCDFQTKGIQIRHAYWDQLSPVFDPLVPQSVFAGESPPSLGEDPFIYCGSTLSAAPAPG